MSRLIDADALKGKAKWYNIYSDKPPYSIRAVTTQEIDWMPPVTPKIIRCKDCKYNTTSKKCLQPDSFFLVPADDFYCGYAEAREGAKQE